MEVATIEGMITHVVVRSGDTDSLRGSRASPDSTEAAGKKDASAPEDFREKEHAEVKLRIAKEGSEAEGIVEREHECRLMFSTQRGHVVINEAIPFKVVQTTDRGCLFGRDLHKVQNSRNRQVTFAWTHRSSRYG
ncbi:hypothetical protein MRX96_056978 [Rhipicephalus microplus]